MNSELATAQSKSQQRRHVRWAPAWMTAIPPLSLLWLAPPGMASELEPVTGSPAAPALGIKDLGDRIHQLDDYTGQVILVNFWATWCPPCVAELPSLQRLYTSLSDQRFVLLAVSMGEGKRRIEHFKETAGIDFPLLLDPTSDVSQRWEVDFLPTSHVIDVRGRLRYTAYGEVDWDDNEVRATLRALLEEAGSGPASAD